MLILTALITLAYLVYYGAIISQDYIAIKKSDTSNVETFDIGDMADAVQTVEVHETTEPMPNSGVASQEGQSIPKSESQPVQRKNKENDKEGMGMAEARFNIELKTDEFASQLEAAGKNGGNEGVVAVKDQVMVIRHVLPEAYVEVEQADENENILEDYSREVEIDAI